MTTVRSSTFVSPCRANAPLSWPLHASALRGTRITTLFWSPPLRTRSVLTGFCHADTEYADWSCSMGYCCVTRGFNTPHVLQVGVGCASGSVDRPRLRKRLQICMANASVPGASTCDKHGPRLGAGPTLDGVMHAAKLGAAGGGADQGAAQPSRDHGDCFHPAPVGGPKNRRQGASRP
jgi:hypothetical protein